VAVQKLRSVETKTTMNDNGIVFVGDLHLSDYIWKHKNIYGDSANSWHQICDFCTKTSSDLVLLGDVLDTPRPSSSVIDELVSGLNRLGDSGSAVYYIQGQHCMAAPPWIYSLMRHSKGSFLHLGLDPVTTGQGIRLAGSDYVSPFTIEEDLLDRVQDCDILCAHLLFSELCGGGSGDLELQTLLDVMEDHGIQLAAVGDYHEAVSLTDNVFYTGSMCMRSLTEPPNKSFVHLDTTSMTLSSVPLSTRRVLRYLKVHTRDDLDNLINEMVNPELDHPELSTLVYVEYSSQIAEANDLLVHACRDAGYILWGKPVIISDDLEDTQGVISAPGVDLTVKECLLADCPENTPAHEFILQLVESEDFRQVITDGRPEGVNKILDSRVSK